MLERVHDELHARCLVLDDGSTKLAIVVCDNGTPRSFCCPCGEA